MKLLIRSYSSLCFNRNSNTTIFYSKRIFFTYLTLEAGLLGLLFPDAKLTALFATLGVVGVSAIDDCTAAIVGDTRGINRLVLWMNFLMSESEYSFDPCIACSILSELSCSKSCWAMGFVSPNRRNCWRMRGSSSRVGMFHRSRTWPRVSCVKNKWFR